KAGVDTAIAIEAHQGKLTVGTANPAAEYNLAVRVRMYSGVGVDNEIVRAGGSGYWHCCQTAAAEGCVESPGAHEAAVLQALESGAEGGVRRASRWSAPDLAFG